MNTQEKKTQKTKQPTRQESRYFEPGQAKQKQLLVQWSPSYIFKEQLPIWKSLGYLPIETETHAPDYKHIQNPIQDTEVNQIRNEHKAKRTFPKEGDLHTLYQNWRANANHDYKKNSKNNIPTKPNIPLNIGGKHLIHVTWKPKWEPYNIVSQNP